MNECSLRFTNEYWPYISQPWNWPYISQAWSLKVTMTAITRESSTEEVSQWLLANTTIPHSAVQILKDNMMDGAALMETEDEHIRMLFPGMLGLYIKLTAIVKKIKAAELDTDPISEMVKSFSSSSPSLLSLALPLSPTPSPSTSPAFTSQSQSDQETPHRASEDCASARVARRIIPATYAECHINVVYSDFVQSHLDQAKITAVWDRLIDETAHFLMLRHPELKTYQKLGRAMCAKYPCLAVNSGRSEWSYFCGKLSQKIRNLRWKEKAKRDGGPKAAKVTRFVGTEANTLEDLDNAKTTMRECLQEAKQDQAKLSLLQKQTFSRRREWIKKEANGAGGVIREYPILGKGIYVEKEYQLMNPEHNQEEVVGNFSEMFPKLKSLLAGVRSGEGTSEKFRMLAELQTKIGLRGKGQKALMKPVLTKVESTDFSPRMGKSGESPRLVLVDDSGVIIAEGVCYACKGDTLEEMLLELLKCYAVWGLQYPKQYQLLGFLEKQILKGNSPFLCSSGAVAFNRQYMLV